MATDSGITKKVLVVEDDIPSFLLINEILRPLYLDIHHVIKGEDAVEFIKMNPDTGLILMDLKLPIMDGYEATGIIEKINLHKKVNS